MRKKTKPLAGLIVSALARRLKGYLTYDTP